MTAVTWADGEVRPASRLACAAACLLALGACSGGGAAEAAGADAVTSALPSVAPGTWVVIGSSTAAGAGATPGGGWASRVQATYSERLVDVVNLAVGGSTTYAGLSTESEPMEGRPPPDPAGNVDAAVSRGARLLLVDYPTNDTVLGYSVDETVGNLLAIRDTARSRDVAVVVLSTQPRALPVTQVAMLAQIDARLSSAVGPCFVAVREALAGPDGTLDARYDAGDGVHLNDSGHALVHARVRAVVDSGRCVDASSR